MRDIPERDWKVLRGLADVALERFCKRVLEEAAPIVGSSGGPSGSYHGRYLALYRLLREQNKEMADTFDDLKRSTAKNQLFRMRADKLLTDEEFARFSQETRDSVDRYLRSLADS